MTKKKGWFRRRNATSSKRPHCRGMNRTFNSVVMPGFAPGIHEFLSLSKNSRHDQAMDGGWVYIVTNKPNGILYVGVTSDLLRRAGEHRMGAVDGFTKRYGLKRLVYAERHEDIRVALQREKTLKHWSRASKVRLIHEQNPDWSDLYDQLL